MQYVNDIEGAKKIIKYTEKKDRVVTAAEGISPHALKYAAVKDGYNGAVPNLQVKIDLPDDSSHIVMDRTSYLMGMRMSKRLAEKFREWLRKGKVIPVSSEYSVFPKIIRIGYGIDTEERKMGNRILSAN